MADIANRLGSSAREIFGLTDALADIEQDITDEKLLRRNADRMAPVLLLDVAGTANAITANIPAWSEFTDLWIGQVVIFTPIATNTGAASLTVAGVNYPILPSSGIAASLLAGAIQAGRIYQFRVSSDGLRPFDMNISDITAATLARVDLAASPRQIFIPAQSTPQAAVRTTGTVTAEAGSDFSASGFMKVRAGGKVYFSHSITLGASYGVVFYNTAREVVSAIPGSIVAGSTLDVPANAVWMRTTINTSNIYQAIILDAAPIGAVTPSRVTYPANSGVVSDMVESASSEYGRNVMTLDGASIGVALNSATAAIQTNFPDYLVTDYISFPEGAKLRFSEQRQLGSGYGPVFYDANNTPVWGMISPTTDGLVFTPPYGAVKFRITLRQTSAPNYSVNLWGVSKAENNPWAGRRLIALGDSITAATYNWPAHVCDLIGMDLQITAALGGRKMEKALYAADDTTQLTAADFADADLVMLCLGTNDVNVTTIGTIDDAAGASTFYGITKNVIETILGWNPDTRLAVCGLLWRLNQQGGTVTYHEALREVARFYAVPFLDFRYLSGFNGFNYTWSLPDGLHPSDDGYRRLYVPAVRGFIQGISPIE